MKHQNGDQFSGPLCPQENLPDDQAGNSGRRRSISESLELRCGGFSPLECLSQKEIESPLDAKIHRLSQAIEMGHRLCYRFDGETGICDVFARRTPGDDEKESDEEVEQSLPAAHKNPERHMLTSLQGASQKENKSPSDEKIYQLAKAIEMGRHLYYRLNIESGEYDIFARGISGDDGRGPTGEVDQHLVVAPTESGRRMLSPLQHSSQKENKSPDDKFRRVLEAVETGRQIHFRLNEGIHGYDVFARNSGDGGSGPDGDVGHRFAGAPTNSGQGMHDYSPTHGTSHGIPREPSQLGDARPSDQGSISPSDQKSIRPGNQESCEEPIVLAERKLEFDQEWASDEDERGPRNQPPEGSMEENPGDRVAVMCHDKILFRKISPIPFDIHRVPLLRTPSVSSNSTESENRSPSYPYSYQAAVENGNQELVLTSTEGSETREKSISEEHFEDVKTWLDHTKPSLLDMHREKPEAFEIWQDSEHDDAFLSGEQEETGLELKVLGDSEQCSSSPSGKQEETGKTFKLWKNMQLRDSSPPGEHNGTMKDSENWEDNELGDLAPNDKQKKTAESFEIWEDNKLSDLALIGKQKAHAGSFEVWNDAEHDYSSTSQLITALPYGALNNVTNIPHSQYLMMADSARASAVAWDMKNHIDAQRVASLRKAKKLPHSGPSRLENEAKSPAVGQADNRINAILLTNGLSALLDDDTDLPPCPPNTPSSSAAYSDSSSSEGEDRTPGRQHRHPLAELEVHSPNSPPLARVAISRVTNMKGNPQQKRAPKQGGSCAFASATLDWSMSLEPSSPIQRFAHPIPRRWINPDDLLERFHGATEIISLNRASIFTTSSQ